MGARGSQDKEWLDRLLGGNGRWFARWLLTQNALNGGATERNASLANLRRERSYCDIQVDDVQAAVVTLDRARHRRARVPGGGQWAGPTHSAIERI